MEIACTVQTEMFLLIIIGMAAVISIMVYIAVLDSLKN
jgi:hypothetical protein